MSLSPFRKGLAFGPLMLALVHAACSTKADPAPPVVDPAVVREGPALEINLKGASATSDAAVDVAKDAGLSLLLRDAGVKIVDAGARDSAPPQDAGKSAADSGVPSAKDAGVAAMDAGVKKADGGAPMTAERKAIQGKCEAGWIIFPTGSDTCRKTCTTDADCSGLVCAPKGSQKLCR